MAKILVVGIAGVRAHRRILENREALLRRGDVKGARRTNKLEQRSPNGHITGWLEHPKRGRQRISRRLDDETVVNGLVNLFPDIGVAHIFVVSGDLIQTVEQPVKSGLHLKLQNRGKPKACNAGTNPGMGWRHQDAATG